MQDTSMCGTGWRKSKIHPQYPLCTMANRQAASNAVYITEKLGKWASVKARNTGNGKEKKENRLGFNYSHAVLGDIFNYMLIQDHWNAPNILQIIKLTNAISLK